VRVGVENRPIRGDRRYQAPGRFCQYTRNAIRVQHLVSEWLGDLASDTRHSHDEPFREARPRVSESQLFLDRWWSSCSLSFVTAPATPSERPPRYAG
jgi:hypothetical protein